MASFTAKDSLPAAAPAQQVSAFASSSSSSSAAQLVEDESRKKNTDCVYFLASPLTCKKGSECEYRHSEFARVNPRDCYYWLNGKCLNPKCSFRHPPLDTLLGTPGDSSAGGSSMPASSSATTGSSLAPSHAVPSAPYVAAKSTAPCIFFQQGYCLKGDRCPFSHGPNFVSNKAPEFPAANVSEFSRFNTAAGGLVKSSQIKIAPRANMSKPVESVPPQPRPSVHVVKAVPTNGAFAEKRGMLQPNVSNEGLPKYNEATSRSLNNGNSKSKSGIPSQAISREDQRLQSGKEADDSMRESSPGFDVLVDDEVRDENYYGNDDEFPRIRGHEGRDHNEFEINRRDRYKSLDEVDPSIYHDRHGYDRYKPLQRHARDSSEKSIMEGSNYDRRGAYKGGNPDGAMNSDLRQRLSKQRRTNGQNSVVKADYPPDNLAEEHRYRSSRRDSRHSPPRGSSIGSRLQGRIKLPGQPSSVHPPTSVHSEREYEKGRNNSRLSPTRPQSHRGRLQDRLKGKVQDDIGRDAAPGRDVLDYNSPNFTAPKSLAELRKAKQPHSQSRELPKRSEEFPSVGKRRALESSQHSEDDISFEAPKPLSEILKRKRKAGDTEEVGKNTNKENAAVEKQAANEEEENKLKEDAPLAPNKETNLPADVEESDPVPVEESEAQNLDFDNKGKPTDTEISQANNVFEAEEEGLITEGVEGREYEEEYYEEGEAVYEDEQEGGGEEGYNLEEGENGELPDEDYMEEDEEDNFAKKIGVMFS